MRSGLHGARLKSVLALTSLRNGSLSGMLVLNWKAFKYGKVRIKIQPALLTVVQDYQRY
jgi:hypothetical protein